MYNYCQLNHITIHTCTAEGLLHQTLHLLFSLFLALQCAAGSILHRLARPSTFTYQMPITNLQPISFKATLTKLLLRGTLAFLPSFLPLCCKTSTSVGLRLFCRSSTLHCLVCLALAVGVWSIQAGRLVKCVHFKVKELITTKVCWYIVIYSSSSFLVSVNSFLYAQLILYTNNTELILLCI